MCVCACVCVCGKLLAYYLKRGAPHLTTSIRWEGAEVYLLAHVVRWKGVIHLTTLVMWEGGLPTLLNILGWGAPSESITSVR